jgi:hypothetical protein
LEDVPAQEPELAEVWILPNEISRSQNYLLTLDSLSQRQRLKKKIKNPHHLKMRPKKPWISLL